MDNFPNWADHIVVFIFCILLPCFAIQQNLKKKGPVVYTSEQKRSMYLSTCISLFIMAAIVVSVWLLFRRPAAEIGLTFQINGWLWIWPAIAFVVAYTIDAINSVATPQKIADSKNDWQQKTPFMPTIKKELRVYFLLCLCAGIFEEIVYRGYMVTYFAHQFRDSGYRHILSAVLPAVVFAVSHFYQGVKSVIKIFVLSTLFGFIFIQSGSLVIVMILHISIDAVGGLLTVKYIGENNEAGNSLMKDT